MTHEDLRQAAIAYLAKAFQGRGSSARDPAVVQAAVALVLTPAASTVCDPNDRPGGEE